MEFKEKYIKIHIETLLSYSKLSRANRLKCSSLLVSEDNTRVLAVGYNGTPAGIDNECEDIVGYTCSNCGETLNNINDFCLSSNKCKNYEKRPLYVTKPIVVHAEANLVSYCAKHGIRMKGNLVYITHSPCVECAKLLVSSGISKVFYLDDYRSDAGLELLSMCNIPYEKLNK